MLTTGIYYTFVGAAIDLPVDARNSFTIVTGAQLRTRCFHSTEPREYDYYSPRWYAQVLPVLQLRCYSGGWRYLVAGGIGAQRDAVSDRQSSRFLTAGVATPSANRGWFAKAALQYSNTPLRTGVYDYLQFSVR